jgi:hypothetical protein
MIPHLELAARLRDAHAPEAPPWWPPAPGWWIALLAALLLAAVALRTFQPRWRRWRLRRRLLAALEDAVNAAEVSQLLRAAALARFPEHEVAGLHGADWIAFLEARDRAHGRFAALREALTEMPYRTPRAGDDIAPLREAARGWLRAVV